MLNVEQVRDILDYCPASGIFRWREPLNARLRRGSEAGVDTKFGYRAIQLYGKKHYMHRLAWLHHYGSWPNGQIDHKDRNRKNNAIENLRVVTATQNRVNAPARRDNSTGTRGVSFHKVASKFAVVLGGKTRRYYGLYSTLEEAVVVRDREALKRYGKYFLQANVRKPESNCAINVEN